MQVVGIFLMIVSIWTVYCGVESFNPLLMALAILQNPANPQSVVAAGKAAVTSSSGSASSSTDAFGPTTTPGFTGSPFNVGSTPSASSGSLAGRGNAAADKSAYQNYAFQQLASKYGITDTADQQALIQLWNHESGWNPQALNAGSGAHGIPQALDTTTAAGAKLPRNATAQQQIDWGLAYIVGRYKTPAAAWSFEMSHSPNWY